MTVHAEISIVPISGGNDTSMSKEIAYAFEAIRKIKNIKVTLTALGTQVETKNLGSVFSGC
jgi:uncharacterized protein YqgV (UPF0045/DUF77 family)